MKLLLLRTSEPAVAFWPDDKPFKIPECQVLPPMGLLYLASVVRHHFKSSIEVMVESLSTAVENREEIGPWLHQQKPDIIGISSMTVEEPLAIEVANAAREANPNVIVVLGGPYPTFQPRESLERTGAVVAVRGEGEQVIAPLLEALMKGTGLENVPSLTFKRDGVFVETPAASPIEPLDELPFPAWDMVPLDVYSRLYNMNGIPLLKPPYAPLLTSRGCPFRCSFCHNMFGRRFRARSPNNVLDEMTWLHDSFGVREFHIIDDIFNYDGKRMEEICRGILKRKLDIAFTFPNGIRGDILTFSQIELLREAGCYSMCLSIESASPRILKLMRKKLNLEKLEENARFASSIGIITKGIFMVGYPSETREEMEETLRWVKESSFDLPQHSVACPLPGTEMIRHALEFNKNFDFNASQIVNYNAFKNLTAMDDEEFRSVLSNGVSEILSHPRRVARLKEIRKMWGREAERYFDWTLPGEFEGPPTRGARDESVPPGVLEPVIAAVLAKGGLGEGWTACRTGGSVVRFTLPDGRQVSILVNYRDDTRNRIGYSNRFNLIFLPGDGQEVIESETIGKIVAAFRKVDPPCPTDCKKPFHTEQLFEGGPKIADHGKY